jgi:hypothetical protein
LVKAEPAGPDSAGSAPEAPAPAEDSSGDLSHFARIKTWVRLWFPATVVVLAVLGTVVTVYGFWELPDTAAPRPGQSTVEVDFSPGHAVSAPITVALTLSYDDPYVTKGSEIELDIDLKGADLAHTGWSMYITVPTGVQLDDPQGARVIRHVNGSDTEDAVYVDPGPQRFEGYSTSLIWNDARSGPLQVDGANLAAWFPEVQVDNWTSMGSNAPSVPEPQVAVTRNLDLYEQDFTYLAGQPPDQFNASGWWTWKPAETTPINEDSGAFSPGFYLEARSATADESASNAEFKSGIAFGIAAAAFIAAIQEFVGSATDSERHPRRKASGDPPRMRGKARRRKVRGST